ncbi:MAG: hypothetical protein GY841_06800 [FCB group bacterium]|nr:hypothetical protein [FCB group bacterium]
MVQLVEDKTTGPVACCWCNNRNHFIKHGTYQRYAFTTDELVRIQRYLCKNGQCNRTFSILPHPFLRITRFSLCMFEKLLELLKQELRIAEIARCYDLCWQTIARAIATGKDIFSWLRQEARTDPVWAPKPCLHPHLYWSDFIRVFAAKFYPKRYGKTAPTE